MLAVAVALLLPQIAEAPLPPDRHVGEHAGAVTAVAFFDKGKRLVTASDAGELRIWDARSGVLVAERDWHEDVGLVEVLEDGRQIAFVSRSTLCVIEPKKAKLRGSVRLDRAPRCLLFVPKRRHLFTGYDDGGMNRFQSGGITSGHDTWGTNLGPLLCLASAADGEPCVGGTAAGGLFAIAPGELEVTARWDGHELAVNAVDLSEDGERLLSASDDGTARLWDVELMKELVVLEVGAPVADARLAAKGALAITGDAGGTVTVWSLEGREALLELKSAEPGPIVALDLDPKERTLVAVGPGAGVSVWELDLAKLAR